MRKKILVIDDEKAILNWVKLALEKTGRYEVSVLSNGREAVQHVRIFRPDMAFIDINMPEVEGSVVAFNIRSDPAFANLPIVFMTGQVTAEEVKLAGGQIGGQEFMAKPIDLAVLTACIDKHLQ